MSTHEPSVFSAQIGDQLSTFLDEHRHMLAGCLDGLTEAEVRQRLVPSKTTLLGLVKHATFVERVWFEEAVTCRPRAGTGIDADPDESFDLSETDTIESVRSRYLQACAASRQAVEHLGVDDVVNGNRRGPLPLRWIYLHVLRELAQHTVGTRTYFESRHWPDEKAELSAYAAVRECAQLPMTEASRPFSELEGARYSNTPRSA